MIGNALAATQAVLALLDQNGEALKARAKIDTAVRRAQRVEAWHAKSGNVFHAAATAISDGQDPAGDPLVQAALARMWLAERPRGLEDAAGEQLVSAVRPHLSAVVAALGNVYDALVAQPVTEAAATLEQQGVTPDTDSDSVIRTGAGDDWMVVSNAHDAHVRITGAYALLRGAYLDRMLVSQDAFLWADPGELGFTAMTHLNRARPTPWSAVVAGCTLGLTSVQGAIERQARAAAVDQGQVLERQVQAKKPSLI